MPQFASQLGSPSRRLKTIFSPRNCVLVEQEIGVSDQKLDECSPRNCFAFHELWLQSKPACWPQRSSAKQLQVQGNKSGVVRLDTLTSILVALWRIAPNRAGKNVMHRYEQVDQPLDKAVTLTFGTNGGRDRGEVTGPTKIALGQQVFVPAPQPGSLTPTKAFAMAEELADQLGLPLVVVDPDGIWNPIWGELYRSAGLCADGVTVIAPGIWRNVTVGRANSM